MSRARATAAGCLALAVAGVLWATRSPAASAVAIGAGFAIVLVHNRWKYDPGDAYEWGWANAALGMAGGGLLAAGLSEGTELSEGTGLGLGLALGSGAALVLLPRLKRPREKRRDSETPG